MGRFGSVNESADAFSKTTTYTYDAAGNLVQKGNTRHTYNALNKLESCTGADGYNESYTN